MLLKKWYLNQRIIFKIIIVFVPLIVFPLLILGFTSYHNSKDVLIQKTLKNTTDNSRIITARINNIIKSAENCAKVIIMNLNQANISKYIQDSNKISNRKLYLEIKNSLKFALMVFPDVDSVVFIDNNKKIYGTNSYIEEKYSDDFILQFFVNEIEKAAGSSDYWFSTKQINNVLGKNFLIYILGKKVIDIDTGERLGYILINISEKTFSNIYKGIGLTQNTKHYILNEHNNIISAEDKDMLMKQFELNFNSNANAVKIINFNGEKMILSNTKISGLNCSLVSIIPLKELISEISNIKYVIIIVEFICLMISSIGLFILSKIIVNPITNLTHNMNMIKHGNLNVNFQVYTNDELGELASGFNNMILRIKKLIKKVKYEQKRKREFELALLQEQIKPHFLYNTLDLIYVLCAMNRREDAQNTTKALADFYRSAVSNGKELIIIEEELKNVQDYLLIQQTRYSDVFEFIVNVDKRIYNFLIPKLTLQPLVENAIYHGLKPKEGNGILKIVGYKDEKENMIIIKVIDNGIGISKEIIENIEKNKEMESNGVGIRNIDKRIKLYFGKRYGLKIKKLKTGTEVMLKLPAKGVDN